MRAIENSAAGFNASTLAIQVPKSALARGGATPTNPADSSAIIGVWSTASRFATRTLSPGAQIRSGALVQVSRLGNPLVNEAAKAGTFSASLVTSTSQIHARRAPHQFKE